jgi:hypothetical protein
VSKQTISEAQGTAAMKDEEKANLNLAVARIARNRQPPFVLQHTQSIVRNEEEVPFLPRNS